MKLYVHTWLDKQTGRVCKTGDGYVAASIEEAIESYHEEDCSAYNYNHTLIIDTQAKTFIEIDIQAEIEGRKTKEMTVGELADYMGLTCRQVERIESRTY